MKAQGIHLENMKRVRSFPEGGGFFYAQARAEEVCH